MKVLIVECGKQPYEAEIENTLKAKQEIVGGPIDVLEPWDDSAIIVLNDEAKNQGLKTNRIVGKVEIAGTFLVCGCNASGDMTSLTTEQSEIYRRMFNLLGDVLTNRTYEALD